MTVGKLCLYQKHDNGIREFIFVEASNRAVDEWIRHFDTIMAEDPFTPGEPRRILTDTCKSGTLPMYYTLRRIMEWYRRQPPITEVTLNAQLYSANTFYITLAEKLLKVMPAPNTRTAYFLNDRDAAIKWLLTGQNTPGKSHSAVPSQQLER